MTETILHILILFTGVVIGGIAGAAAVVFGDGIDYSDQDEIS